MTCLVLTTMFLTRVVQECERNKSRWWGERHIMACHGMFHFICMFKTCMRPRFTSLRLDPTGVHVQTLGANTFHLSRNAEQLDLCALLSCPLLQEHLYSLLGLLAVLHEESKGIITSCNGNDATVDSLDSA